MAALGGDLRQQILGHSDAAKAFRPWWDNLEDGIMYSLVVMGLIVLPMTFLSRTPLDCAVHPHLWFKGNETAAYNITEVPKYARYLRSYAQKYCTEMYVSPFLRYLPFSLFLVPLLIVFAEKFFIGIYNCEVRLEQFYSCLIKGSLEREDVANVEQENIKSSHEIQQTFRNSANVYRSYLYRTAVELVLSIGLAIYFSAFSNIDGIASALFDCDVHGIPFKCIISNSKFFWSVYALALFLILVYICCTLYNLIWIAHPRVGKLDRILAGCNRRKNKEVDQIVCVRPSSVPEVRLDMYFDPKGKDFRLLLNLLAECSGLAYPFRILAVFDKHFQRQWRARDIKIIVEEHQSAICEEDEDGYDAYTNRCYLDGPASDEDFLDRGLSKEAKAENEEERLKLERHKCLWVLWNDCSIAEFISKSVSRRSLLEYTVDITPCTEAPVKSFLYHSVPDFTNSQADHGISSLPAHLRKRNMHDYYDRESAHSIGLDLNFTMSTMYKYCTRFDGLMEGTEYTVALSTELDGKTITQVTMEVNKSSKEQTKAKEPGTDKADKGDEDKKKKKKDGK